MILLTEKTQDIGQEKHVPIIEKTQTGIKVKVGSLPHPMEEKHYIEWIELLVDGKSFRQFLKPGNLPEAEKLSAREYCNIHGLWKN